MARDRLRLARRTNRMGSSAVREILKVTERPDIISFAGGLPAMELFPAAELARATVEVLSRDGGPALQYSTTEGFGPLREWIAARMQGKGCTVTPDEILITTASQQGIDLAGKVFVDPGDAVLVERPTYLAALQTLGSFEARFVTVGTDDDGMILEEAEAVLAREKPKLIYIVSNFSNPTGITLSAGRRPKLVELAAKFGVPLLEDDPYGDLRYRGQSIPPLKAFDRHDIVIYLSTFSKILSPGLRLGWLALPREVYRNFVVAKQATDLHSSTLTQRTVMQYLIDNSIDDHIAYIRRAYGARCQTMLDGLERYFPSGTGWTRPEGGLFLWASLPEALEAEVVFEAALSSKVAIVPGASFFAEGRPHHFMRLNFSNQPPDRISEGIRKLGSVIEAEISSIGSSGGRERVPAL
ncbi:MAG: PLP-dependent aminotransferase family protein [Acidobacteria bacterium]|nr:PLP-dependent aminotransferase family protein [Acidobacteriota bacterium]